MDHPTSSATQRPLYWLLDMDRPRSKFELHSELFLKMLLEKQGEQKSSQFHCLIEAVLKARVHFEQNEVGQKNDGEFTASLPAVIATPTGTDTAGIVFMLPYVLESRKVLILAPSQVIGNEISKAFGYRCDETCFFDTLGLFSSNPKEKERQEYRFMEPIRVFRDQEEETYSLGNLVVLNAQRFGDRSTFSLYYKHKKMLKDSVEFFEQFDTFIVSEAHHYPAKTWLRITEAYQKSKSKHNKKIIFLTATSQHQSVDNQMKFIFGKKDKVRIVHTLPQKLAFGSACRPREFIEPAHDGQPFNVFKDLQRILEKSAEREPRFTPQALILVKFKKEVSNLAEALNAESGLSNFAVGMLENKRDFEAFSNGDFQVGIVRNVCKEMQENRNIVACVILRKIVHGKLLFAQFVRCCLLMKWGLEGGLTDKSIGHVLSYPEFNQRKLFDNIDELAEEDPLETNECVN